MNAGTIKLVCTKSVFICTNACVLSDTTVSTSATRMKLAQGRSGWIMFGAPVMKQTLCSADMQDGEHTTVRTPRTSQYRVSITPKDNSRVSTFTNVEF